MFSARFIKMLRFLPLLALPFLAWLIPLNKAENPGTFSPEKVNLALRRTADGLLRASGDSTSRIPAIEQRGTDVWRVRLESHFQYDQLPALLQASLDIHGIRRPYDVTVRRCDNATVDLGYHQLDFLQNNQVACQGREMPEGCHFIEIRFLTTEKGWGFWPVLSGALLLLFGGLAGYWLSVRQKSKPVAATAQGEKDWLKFGHSQLDVAGQVLICSGISQSLTFRETKLLRLFANHPDRLLDRDQILKEVWADEGVLVGRSVDVFVSRLRKKLAADPTIGIVAVHGVGYRLETGKVG